MSGPLSSTADDRSSKLSSRGTTCAEGTDGGLGVAGFAGTPGPRCARFRPCFGTAWPAVELWGTMDIRRSPDRCALLEHDLEAYGRTEKRCRMGVGGGGGGTASSRTTTVPNGKLRGGRRKRRRPDGRHERARSLAKRICRPEGVRAKSDFFRIAARDRH